MTYKISDYCVMAQKENGEKFYSRCDGTDTPIADFKEVYRHAPPFKIIALFDLKDPTTENLITKSKFTGGQST
jgi:hypothetical protein